ncbi:MAG: RelA/SpoT family protein [Fibrobacterota bacterium]
MTHDFSNLDAAKKSYIRRLNKISSDLDYRKIEKAFYFSWNAHEGQFRKSGEPYFIHPLEVSLICAEQGMGTTGVVSALLHDVIEDTAFTKDDVEREFGRSVSLIVDGVTKLTSVHEENKHFRKVETYRKVLLTAAEDIRVIIIKFADRLHNLRTLAYMPREKKERIARETLDIYVPLVLRLGMGSMMAELQDLAFKHLYPDKYREVVARISESESSRQELIRTLRKILDKHIKKNKIEAEVFGRSKSYYSIYKKNQNRRIPYNEIFDLLAIRIICNTTEDCYRILGLVHSLWPPVPYKLKDYIASPKSNGYQAIHTTVGGYKGKIVEVQIRTREMDHHAEEGVAAHWRYKNTPIGDSNAVQWLKNLVKWQKELSDSTEFFEFFKIDIKQRDITVRTPKNEKIILPKGATVIDFAFAIHTEIGLHCIGAKINGHIEKPDTVIQNGDLVEVLHSFDRKPNIEWLNDVKTPRARSEIKSWLRKVEKKDRVSIGKQLLFSEYSKLRLHSDLEEFFPDVFAEFSVRSEEELFEKVAAETQLSLDIVDFISRRVGAKKEVFDQNPSTRKNRRNSIVISKMNTTMVRFASCCHPIPGDDIIGFITNGRGISVHRHDCPTAALFKKDPIRAVHLLWEDSEHKKESIAHITVEGQSRKNLIGDIVAVFGAYRLEIKDIDFTTTGSYARAEIKLSVYNRDLLFKLKKDLRDISAVTKVSRPSVRESGS